MDLSQAQILAAKGVVLGLAYGEPGAHTSASLAGLEGT